MTLVRYGQAAMIAAIMVVTGNAVWAQESGSQGYAPRAIYFSMKPECCKDGKCCKEGDCCAKSKKCDAKCTSCKTGQCCKAGDSCCKDSKCASCKDGECCCDKNDKCSCGKGKTSTTKIGCDCPFLSKLAKSTAIIMVMPASMPLPACCMEMMGMMPHPPMPLPGPHVWLPPPPMMMPPMPVPPPINVQEANTGNVIYGYGVNSNCSLAGSICAGTPNVAPCGIVTPTTAAKVRIIAASTSDQVEMTVGDETCVRCKKMTIKIGDNEITVSRFNDRVRIRGEELKATASSVGTDGKGNFILAGNAELHFKKNGRPVGNSITGESIKLNMSDGVVRMTIVRPAKTPTIGISPVIHESK